MVMCSGDTQPQTIDTCGESVKVAPGGKKTESEA